MKAFDCIYHDDLIANLSAYGFDRSALKFIYGLKKLNYKKLKLSDRSQKTEISSSFRPYLDTIYGVPQGSILGPMLCNRDLCDLFFEDYSSDFANFADDTICYGCESTLVNE